MVCRFILRMYYIRPQQADKGILLVREIVQPGMSFQIPRLFHAKLYRLHEQRHYYTPEGTVSVIHLRLMDDWMNWKCKGTLWLGMRGWMDWCWVQNGNMSERWSNNALVI
jgi:hypothetical protein